MQAKFKNICFRFGTFLVDVISPPDPSVREIENMDPAQFMQRAKMIGVQDASSDILCFFSYRDPIVKKAILEVKLRGNAIIAQLLGKVLHELLISELEDFETFNNFKSPILVPIPLTKKSLRERGWNQCVLFADAINAVDTEKTIKIAHNLLIKVKDTEDQVGKSRGERLENLKGAFGVSDKRIVSGRNIIVLDDIMTTGATLSEAKRALKEAGAKKVLCVAIAH